MKEVSFIEKWLEEAEARAEARGEERGETKASRKHTLSVLKNQFGEIPVALTARIESMDTEKCEALMERALEGASLEDLQP